MYQRFTLNFAISKVRILVCQELTQSCFSIFRQEPHIYLFFSIGCHLLSNELVNYHLLLERTILTFDGLLAIEKEKEESKIRLSIDQ